MRLAAFLAFSVLVVTSASAQSLADVARQEGERRQAVSTSGKSYSNKDLRSARPDASDAAQTSAGAGASAAQASASASDAAGVAADAAQKDAADASTVAESTDESKKEAKDEKYWSKRAAELRQQLERDQTFLQALQSRVDALTTDFVNRDDPAQRGQIASDRQKTLAELERLRKAIEADKRAIPELEDEARRSGVPAGWLR